MINYSVNARKNPQDKDAAPKYYATVQKVQNIDLNNIADRISLAATATRADVLAVITAVIDYLMTDLQAGHSVNLGELGTFRMLIKSKGAATADDFSADFITSAHVRYYPSKRIKNIYNDLTFKRVPSRKTVTSILHPDSADDDDVVVEED